jgi:hypothetical protein
MTMAAAARARPCWPRDAALASPLEQSFTAVYWDQRGAGKSFDRAIPRSSMTVEQLICDLDELVDGVCNASAKPRSRSSGTPAWRISTH